MNIHDLSFAQSFIKWVKDWDYMAIFYGIIATLVCIIVAKWIGAFKYIYKKYKYFLAVRAYKESVSEKCETLIVIGKRKGFKLKEVYVELDVAPSDLMTTKTNEKESKFGANQSHVLVGAPGAGKSTTVKKILITCLNDMRFNLRTINILPVFIRLRDYHGYKNIEECIVHQLSSIGFEEPEKETKYFLTHGKCLCVLDGLDEVRPKMRKKTIDDINTFYHKYFLKENHLIVTCRKEAYRNIPLDLPLILEVRPLTDEQIKRFAKKWPIPYPPGKTEDTFWSDMATTPRILELGRSPLLLVGGLMQYTESNLGIPEERFEYIQRVSKWLLSEWSLAQGQPSDPLHRVYDRVLARLAYYMHKLQLVDLQRSKAQKLIEEWLPNFGITDINAAYLIESIATNTGIIVSDNRNDIVFAQFGLQEYFASLEILQQENVKKISDLEPSEWWREVILLAVAQQREPTKVLLALFDKAPLLAATAVAECPTPSIDMQNKAIDASLKCIDNNEKAAVSAVVPLLRKVQNEIEKLFCRELEVRLSSDGPVSSIVGVALATAGTSRANRILAKYPKVWDVCLREAGYLSASFENLLVKWIKEGTEFESRKASEIIISRLSKDRLNELLELMPVLSKNRSNFLAHLIIDQWESERAAGIVYEHHGGGETPKMPVSVMVQCIPFIHDREEFLKEFVLKVSNHVQGVENIEHPNEKFDFEKHFERVISRVGLTAICLFLRDSNDRQVDDHKTYKAYSDYMRNLMHSDWFMLLIVVGLAMCTAIFESDLSFYCLFTVVCLMTCLIVRGNRKPIWEGGKIQPYSQTTTLFVNILMTMAIALVVLDKSSITIHSHGLVYFICILSIINFADMMNSMKIRSENSYHDVESDKYSNATSFYTSGKFSHILVVILAIGHITIKILTDNTLYIECLYFGVGAIMFFWASTCSGKLKLNGEKVVNAYHGVVPIIEDILKGKFQVEGKL